MKPSKPPHRLMKVPRMSLGRKPHYMMKKPGLSRSPSRSSGPPRSMGSRPSPPRMKRPPVMSSLRKRSRSPHRPNSPHRPISRRGQSPLSVDRERDPKRRQLMKPMYDKEKRYYMKRKGSSSTPLPSYRSPSPLQSLAQQSHIMVHQSGKFADPRSGERQSRYDSSPKKIPSMEPERFRSSPEPPRISMTRSSSQITKMHSSHRSEGNIHSSQVASVITQEHHTGRNLGPTGRDRSAFVTQASSTHMGYGQLPGLDMHSKEVPMAKPIYGRDNIEPFKNNSRSNHGDRYQRSTSAEKQYGTTLDERFRSVSESVDDEPRIHYTKADLQKITIDIHRNLRDHSPTLRHIINPANVKIVRRPDEGRRPIFDRDEIKQAPHDLREDAYFEQKMLMNNRETGMSTYGLNMREIENYEITRHRFDMYHQPVNTTSGRSLSDRWQNLESRKKSTGLDRDERDYEETRPSRDFVPEHRSRSNDRDFRSERYSTGEVPRTKAEYPASQHRPPNSSSNINMSVRRKEDSLPDTRQRIMERHGTEHRSPVRRSDPQRHMHSPQRHMHSPHSDSRRYMGSSENAGGSAMKISRSSEEMYSSQSRNNINPVIVSKNKSLNLSLDEKMKLIQAITVKKLSMKSVQEMFKCGRSVIYDVLKNREEIKHDWIKGRQTSSRRGGSALEPPRFDVRPKEESGKDDKLPDFSRRPDKYSYKPWLEKPDVTPKGPGYFEHDNRERSSSYRGRLTSSRSRPFRTFTRGGYRGRNFRSPRGGSSFRGRGTYRGFTSSPRIRGGLSSRRGRYSPSHWEHDLYSRSSQDRKSGRDAS